MQQLILYPLVTRLVPKFSSSNLENSLNKSRNQDSISIQLQVGKSIRQILERFDIFQDSQPAMAAIFNYTRDFEIFLHWYYWMMLQHAYRVATHSLFTTGFQLLNTSNPFPSRFSGKSYCKMDVASSQLLDYHNDQPMEVVYCSLQCCAINCCCFPVPVWASNCRLYCLLWTCFLISSCIRLHAAVVINENCRAMHHYRAKMGEWVCNGLQRHYAEPKINDDNRLKPWAQQEDHNVLFAS